MDVLMCCAAQRATEFSFESFKLNLLLENFSFIKINRNQWYNIDDDEKTKTHRPPSAAWLHPGLRPTSLWRSSPWWSSASEEKHCKPSVAPVSVHINIAWSSTEVRERWLHLLQILAEAGVGVEARAVQAVGLPAVLRAADPEQPAKLLPLLLVGPIHLSNCVQGILTSEHSWLNVAEKCVHWKKEITRKNVYP